LGPVVCSICIDGGGHTPCFLCSTKDWVRRRVVRSLRRRQTKRCHRIVLFLPSEDGGRIAVSGSAEGGGEFVSVYVATHSNGLCDNDNHRNRTVRKLLMLRTGSRGPQAVNSPHTPHALRRHEKYMYGACVQASEQMPAVSNSWAHIDG